VVERIVGALPERPDMASFQEAERRASLVVDAFEAARKHDRHIQNDDPVRSAGGGPQKAKRRRGKPESMPWSAARKLCADWDAAKRSGGNKADFCAAKGIDPTTLESALRRGRHKRRADKMRRQAR
jgi:hypothetical protein